MPEKKQELICYGIAASNGYAIGRVCLVRHDESFFVEPLDRNIDPSEAAGEIAHFHASLDAARNEILILQEELRSKADASDVGIFDAQLLITDDQLLTREVESMISNNCKPADYAFFKVVEKFVAAISVMPDSYIKERTADIRDVAARVLTHLQERQSGMMHYDDQRIILAHDLTPSDTAALDRRRVLGFAVETGSASSHTAILARSMQLPAVLGISGDFFEAVHDNDMMILDGYTGKLILHPTKETEAEYRRKMEAALVFFHKLASEKRLNAETCDGFVLQLSGNIENVDDVATVQEYGGCGIGLFRSEYMFLNASGLPGEEEQLATYKRMLQAMGSEAVVVRTLDIGGDKLDQALQRYAEPNPFLGLRGIRFCLQERRDVLRTQLRALLRAGVYGNLKVMLPMVTCVEEILEVRALIEELKQELRREKLEFVPDLQIGAMIETPAAALLAGPLAKVVDFFSIGTNDLVQYTLAVDRTNERLNYLYYPTHPAVLTLIANCITMARRHNIPVSVCGEIAGDPKFTPLLVGLGVHELSMPPVAIGPVRRVVRQLQMADAELAAQQVLECETPEKALEISMKMLRDVAPEIAELVAPEHV
ncbi:MAG: phosphoenolpyruvate--protein phosphotransferase [Lentisphaerae bacterium]|nr:phosphoenolpyruvate--protein phosphotransferase [Lentisphaerota bacterium]